MEKLIIIDISPQDIVLYYMPDMDEEDVDWVLWNKTSWPFQPLEGIHEDIYKWYLSKK
jgi:hypothetical protein